MGIKLVLGKVFRKPSVSTVSSRVTVVLLSLFLGLAVAAAIVGTDNVKGITLGYAATATLMVEITRHWQKVRYFIILFFSSILGAIFLAFLHEAVVYPVVEWMGGAEALQSWVMNIFHELVSLTIWFFSPVGVFLGIGGSVVLLLVRLLGWQGQKKGMDI